MNASGPDDWLTMCEDCERRESKLTDWERGFTASVKEQLEGGRGLTERQVEKLDAIWERIT